MTEIRARKDLFARFLEAPDRLHFAAHSHHPWPDVSLDGQQRYWLESAAKMDRKWDRVLGEVVPAAARHVARTLSLPDPGTICFAPNTHELLIRILSCFEGRRPIRILSTDSEFHSFERQTRRLEESGDLAVERVPVEPFDTFAERFAARAEEGEQDLVYVSHVFFNSGFRIRELDALVATVPAETWVVVDGYHAFWALPVDLSRIADQVFYLGGGYKYAMSGEGVCFLHAPPGFGERPVNTGWYAGFAGLEGGVFRVDYETDGRRFTGATFDPSGVYRFLAVMDMLKSEGIDPGKVHAHVQGLQALFLKKVAEEVPAGLSADQLLPPASCRDRGNFLTFRRPDAARLGEALLESDVITDVRGDRLRFGFGIYQDEGDVEELTRRLSRLAIAEGSG